MSQVTFDFKTLAAVSLFLCLTAGTIRAQLTTASVSGLVKDESGAVLPGAAVSARNLETGQARSVSADSEGRYRLTALPIGQYELKVELRGFNAIVRGLTLVVGQQAVIDFSMAVGTVTEQVEVTGEPPLVDTVTGSISALVDDKKIRDLPLNGRSFDALTLLQSGVKSFTSRGGQSAPLFRSGRLHAPGARVSRQCRQKHSDWAGFGDDGLCDDKKHAGGVSG